MHKEDHVPVTVGYLTHNIKDLEVNAVVFASIDFCVLI